MYNQVIRFPKLCSRTFHVWNESWFSNLKLDEAYDGWHAHDSTPAGAESGGVAVRPHPGQGCQGR